MTVSMRAQAPHSPITRGLLPQFSCRHALALAGPERLSGRTASCGITPSPIMSPISTTRPRTEIRLGARAHRRDLSDHPPHPPPVAEVTQEDNNPDAALAAGSLDR